MHRSDTHENTPAMVDVIDPSTLDILEVSVILLPKYLDGGWETLKDYCAFLA